MPVILLIMWSHTNVLTQHTHTHTRKFISTYVCTFASAQADRHAGYTAHYTKIRYVC